MAKADKPDGNGKPENTAGKTAPGRPFLPGFDKRRGHGVAGRSGRRPDEWIKFLKSLLAHPRTQERLEAVITECPDVSEFLKAVRLVEERVFGKPVQPIEPVGKLVVEIRDE
jgi:hypothetical protein